MISEREKQRMQHPTGFQVWSSTWFDGERRLPDRLLFGGQTFQNKQEALSAWYDSCPGRNDHFVIVKVQ